MILLPTYCLQPFICTEIHLFIYKQHFLLCKYRRLTLTTADFVSLSLSRENEFLFMRLVLDLIEAYSYFGFERIVL